MTQYVASRKFIFYINVCRGEEKKERMKEKKGNIEGLNKYRYIIYLYRYNTIYKTILVNQFFFLFSFNETDLN